MFAVMGDQVTFCDWVRRLGGEATPAAPTRRGGWAGAELLYLEAALLLESPRREAFNTTVQAARRDGALIVLVLDDAAWIRRRGGPQTAYDLAAIRPDVLFTSTPAAAELGVPLEGLAGVPVVELEGGGCSVFGRRIPAPSAAHDFGALAAAFCVAFVEGATPVEAAGRAVLVAAQ
jgi:sugar/nucleoside kinase (ribokinase family)